MKIKTIATIVVAETKLEKEIIACSINEIGARMLKWSKNVFDPYTSSVYDEMMDEQIFKEVNAKEANKMAQAIIFNIIKEIDV